MTAFEEFYKRTFYPYQKAFFESKSQFRIVNKARQIGFSWGIAHEMAFGALCGRDSIAGSTGLRASQKLLAQVRRFITAYEPRARFDVDNTTQLTVRGAGTVVSVPANPSTIRGYTGDVYLDEVAHIRNAREIIRAIGPSLTRQDKPRRLTLTSTPMGKLGFFYDAWTNKDGAFGQYERFEVDIYRAIKEGFPSSVQACLSLLGVSSEADEAFQTEFACQFVDEKTSYFPYDLIARSSNSDLQYVPLAELGAYIAARPNSVFFSGYDPAKLVDGAVLYVVERTPAGLLVPVHCKVWRGEKYSEQVAYVADVIKLGITLHITDRTGVGEKVHEDVETACGSVRAQGLTYTNGVKEKLIVNLKSALEDRRLELPGEDIALRTELHGLQREITAGGLHKYRHESGKHDDRVWALANAVYAATSAPKEAEIPENFFSISGGATSGGGAAKRF